MEGPGGKRSGRWVNLAREQYLLTRRSRRHRNGRFPRHRRRDQPPLAVGRRDGRRPRATGRPRADRHPAQSPQRERIARPLLRRGRRRYDQCQEAVARDSVNEHGRIDFLVNNAGITRDHTVRKMTVDEWQTVLQVNLSGPFFMTKAVLEHDDRAEVRPHRQHQFGRRRERELRPSQLRRRESGPDRPHQNRRARSRAQRHHRERGRARASSKPR